MLDSRRYAPIHPTTRTTLALLGLAIALCAMARTARAVPLSASEFSLGLYEMSGSRSLGSGDLGTYFGPHRCGCPVTLSPSLQISDQGKTDLGASTIGVEFMLGANCLGSPASCVSLGKVSFTATLR
jgi:hypothetical protein